MTRPSDSKPVSPHENALVRFAVQRRVTMSMIVLGVLVLALIVVIDKVVEVDILRVMSHLMLELMR